MSDRPRWLPWVVLGFLVLGGGAVAYRLTRGLRNNNPGNIRKTGTTWQGMAPPEQQTDPEFIVFQGPEWGIRALVRILYTYRSQGVLTVRQIISRWAPPSENDTASYISAVAKRVGVGPDEPLTYPAQLTPLVEAIITHENGVQPYSPATIARGIALA